MVSVLKKLKILLGRWNIADKIYKTTKWQIDIRIKNILKEIRREHCDLMQEFWAGINF